MSISPRWSRLLLAGALAAGVGCAGATSASAGEGPKNTGGCSIPKPIPGDYNLYSSPQTGKNYGTGTANGDFLGAYGTNYGDFDLAYTRDSSAPGTISVYFNYYYIYPDGTCTVYESPSSTSIGPGQTGFYEFRNLPAWSGQAVVTMGSSEGYVEIAFD